MDKNQYEPGVNCPITWAPNRSSSVNENIISDRVKRELFPENERLVPGVNCPITWAPNRQPPVNKKKISDRVKRELFPQ